MSTVISWRDFLKLTALSLGSLGTRPWTVPEVSYDPGDVTVSMPGGTLIEVIES